jgi:integrase
MAADSRSQRLTKRTVDAVLPAAKPFRLWDADIKGFGLKVTPRGVKTYVVWYRAGEGRRAPLREYTIARHGVMTPDEARTEAARVLSRVRLGEDPQAQRRRARADITVEALCELYLAHGVATKKSSTLRSDVSRIRAHIVPLLGRRMAAQVTPQDVAKFLRDVASGKSAASMKPSRRELRAQGMKGAALVAAARRRSASTARGGKGTATRTLGLLGAIFSFAVREGVRPTNPVAGVERYRDGQAQRFLTSKELHRLAKALADLEAAGANPSGVAVIRLLTFTGARKSEIESLRWEEVDVARGMLRLADSKTGARVILLGAPARECLAKVEHVAGSAFVFPAQGDPAKHYVGTPRVWERVKQVAGLPGVRLHDLRHTFASFGAAGGLSLPLIGAMLGHRDVKTTGQYAHLADDPLRLAADRTAAAVASAMSGGAADVAPFRPRAVRVR